MRVAILALSLCAVAVSHASAAQVLPATEAPAFSSAIPAVAMNSPLLSAPELVAPAVSRPSLRRASTALSPNSVALRAQRVAMGVGSQRPLSSRPSSPSNSTRTLALRAPHHPARSITDHLLVGVVGLLLIGHQLRRKHRVLRPHPFTT
jgi:hypothetical protein